MGISFKLSKVGVRVQPTARSATPGLPAAAETEKFGTGEKDCSRTDAKREVSGASVACSVGFGRGVAKAVSRTIWVRKVVVFCVIEEKIRGFPLQILGFSRGICGCGDDSRLCPRKGRIFPVISTCEFLVQVPSGGFLGQLRCCSKWGAIARPNIVCLVCYSVAKFSTVFPLRLP